ILGTRRYTEPIKWESKTFSRPCTHRKCHFTEQLQHQFPYIKRAPEDKDYTVVKCSICQVIFDLSRGGRSSITKHSDSAKHKMFLDASSSSQKFPKYGLYIKTFTYLYEKKFHCARTKCEAIINNTFLNFALENLKADLEQARMGRIYHRKTTRGADGGRYSRQELNASILAVKEGRKTVKGAAKEYNIPRSTLRHYVQGSRGAIGTVAQSGTGGGGIRSIPEEDEKRLVEGILLMEKWGFGLSRNEVMDVVQMYVRSNGIKTRFNEGRPEEDWYIDFAKRNKLSIKKP
ncbi:hypothetical protein NQ315_015409, partial [Exocentrus adspersus]